MLDILQDRRILCYLLSSVSTVIVIKLCNYKAFADAIQTMGQFIRYKPLIDLRCSKIGVRKEGVG